MVRRDVSARATEPGLRIELLWIDDEIDMIEVRVEASNGRFAATAELYANFDVFARLATALRGFPASSDDRREFSAGNFDDAYGGGGFRFTLQCADPGGSGRLELHVRADRDGSPHDRTETATFCLAVDASLIDRCVRQLDGIREPVVGARAALGGD